MLNTIYLPTLLGIEAMTSQELIGLGYQKSQITVDDGELTLKLSSEQNMPDSIAELNLNLRTAERVLLGLAEFKAYNFDQLYDQTFALPWHEWIDYQYFLEIIGYSRKSKLHSVPACQSIIKKALTDKLNLVYGYPDNQVPEDSSVGNNRIQFSIIDDLVKIRLDTSGEPLHKRGYRPIVHEAPLRETLAAAILMISFYQRNLKNAEVLYDPFCGSGTFLIEAALIASDTAPGILRSFAAEDYRLVGKTAFDQARVQAEHKSFVYNLDLIKERRTEDRISGKTPSVIYPGQPVRIYGSDISGKSITLARKNAARAKVEQLINFEKKDIFQITRSDLLQKLQTDRILITTNPPYGERMADLEQAELLENQVRQLCLTEDGKLASGMRLSLLTADDEFETLMGFKADRRRKLYNGGIRCTLYHYFKF